MVRKVFFYIFILFCADLIYCSTPYAPHYFPTQEYEHYMQLIKELDEESYNELQACQKINKTPCIDKLISIEFLVEPSSPKTHGYPFLAFKSLKNVPREKQKELLKKYIEKYHEELPLQTEERKKVISIIKSIAPELYEEIEKIDAGGSNHIKRSHYGTESSVSSLDGLPKIYVDHFTAQLPFNELKSTIAHELAHYVLEHFNTENLVSHHLLSHQEEKSTRHFRKGKKISGLLPLKETFQNAYQRTKEDEADRFAILEFGVNIDDAISNAKKKAKRAYEEFYVHPEKETFKSTHKFWKDRIQHLEYLRREVEIRKNRKSAPINWQELAKHYKETLYASRHTLPESKPKLVDVIRKTEELSKFTAILPKKLPRKLLTTTASSKNSLIKTISKKEVINNLIKKYNVKSKTKNALLGVATIALLVSLGTPALGGLTALTSLYAIKRYKNRKIKK